MSTIEAIASRPRIGSSVRPYAVIVRSSLMSVMYYRVHFLFQIVSNAFYIVITWFLWKAVYAGQGTMNGMSFEQTFMYLSLAMTIYVLLQTWTEWDISRQIIQGDIVVRFIKPLRFMWQAFSESLGGVLGNFIAITIPSSLLIIFVFQAPVPLGLNILYFFVSLVFGLLINFFIDYSIGLVAFYTESIWGISNTKQVIVLFLSGAIIPIAFFPPAMQAILQVLPFQAIYNAPLTLLIHGNEMSLAQLAWVLLPQIAWTVGLWALTRFWESRAFRVLTVAGG